jgi:spore coat protein A
MGIEDSIARDGWSRRGFLKLGGLAGAALLVPNWLVRPAFGATLLNATTYPKFTRALPLPKRVNATKGGLLHVDIVQFEQQVLDGYPATTLWGYRFEDCDPSWPGATIVARKDRRVKVKWHNKLPAGDGTLMGSHLLPVDHTLHMPMVMMDEENGCLPVVTHLHGGHTEDGSDGDPQAWFTQKNLQTGPYFQKTYRYDNDQESGTLWYHDHTVGMTRLNVYAGLAGMYLLRDEHELDLVDDNVLPGRDFEIELAIQDRAFTDDGQLFLQVANNVEGGIVPTIFPDFMCVNGAPWPYLDVEPRKYRFRVLNGCDGRFLILKLDNGAPLLRVGTELGLAEEPVAVSRLVMSPAERYDVVIDFEPYAGQEIVLQNAGMHNSPLRGFRNAGGVVTNNPNDTPFGFAPVLANPNSTGLVMKFRVGSKKSCGKSATVTAGGPDQKPTRLRHCKSSIEIPTPECTRKVVLLTGADVVHAKNPNYPASGPEYLEIQRIMELQGTLEEGTFAFMDPVTENPKLGATEVWEIYNYTVPPLGLVHPIHIHLVHFHLLNREKFSVTGAPVDGAGVSVPVDKAMEPAMDHHIMKRVGKYLDPARVVLSGSPRGPEPYEEGLKDTVICYGGEVTRVVMKFDRPGAYVWHCHILHHEDHDMMRPFFVGCA